MATPLAPLARSKPQATEETIFAAMQSDTERAEVRRIGMRPSVHHRGRPPTKEHSTASAPLNAAPHGSGAERNQARSCSPGVGTARYNAAVLR
jgi:hypothetical protein